MSRMSTSEAMLLLTINAVEMGIIIIIITTTTTTTTTTALQCNNSMTQPRQRHPVNVIAPDAAPHDIKALEERNQIVFSCAVAERVSHSHRPSRQCSS